MIKHTLSTEERITLLRLARRAIVHRAKTGMMIRRHQILDLTITPHMDELQGAFVTLEVLHELRGCIGTLTPNDALWLTVVMNAIRAGWEDPRFPMITPDEIPKVSIEITVIGKMDRIKGPDDIRIGQHGLYIVCRGRRGVLLPQVATSRGWKPVTFLEQVCHKAGLAPDTWREPDAQVSRFYAELFSEVTEGIHPSKDGEDYE